MTKHSVKFAFAIISTLNAISAIAATDFSLFGADVSVSGFATAGFAISDQNYKYQRFINNDGTFKRDSILGGQIDIKLNDEFSITAQAKIAPALDSDKEINPILTWAFLSWRPTNDLLFRGGRVRVPMYLNSQNTDIGATFEFARLPIEIYSTAPTTDIDGLSGSKTWNFDVGELTLDSYIGTADTYSRTGSYSFKPLSSPPIFLPVTMNLFGAALTFQHEDSIFRIGVHDTYTHSENDYKFIVAPPFAKIAPNVGYYQVDEQMQGPGLPRIYQIHSFLYTAGLDIALGDGFRVLGEYVRREVRDVLIGPDTQAEYLALLKSFGAWTPYVSVAHLQSTDRVLDFYNKLKNNAVPDFVFNSQLINASQKAAANTIFAYDQTTWAIGTSYQLTPTSKLKAEWAITQTGDASSLIDSPANGDSSNKLINVFSFSYNVAF
ncbi:MAG: hypothetical protein WBI40_02135 [Methylococcaceae bacterium]